MSEALYSGSRRDAEEESGDAELLRRLSASLFFFSASLRELVKAPYGAEVSS